MSKSELEFDLERIQELEGYCGVGMKEIEGILRV